MSRKDIQVPEDIPLQLVRRHEGGLYGTHRCQVSPASVLSRGSSSTENGGNGFVDENEIVVSNDEPVTNALGIIFENKTGVVDTAMDDDTECMKDENDDSMSEYSEYSHQESDEEKLERWRQFYSNRESAPSWDLNEPVPPFSPDSLFSLLLNECRCSVPDTSPPTSPSTSRSPEEARAFWNHVREELADPDSSTIEWPPNEEIGIEDKETDNFMYVAARRNKSSKAEASSMSPSHGGTSATGNSISTGDARAVKGTRTADGRDPYLLEVRSYLTNEYRQSKRLALASATRV